QRHRLRTSRAARARVRRPALNASDQPACGPPRSTRARGCRQARTRRPFVESPPGSRHARDTTYNHVPAARLTMMKRSDIAKWAFLVAGALAIVLSKADLSSIDWSAVGISLLGSPIVMGAGYFHLKKLGRAPHKAERIAVFVANVLV